MFLEAQTSFEEKNGPSANSKVRKISSIGHIYAYYIRKNFPILESFNGFIKFQI